MIFCARATRGLRRPSLDARGGRSISSHPWSENEQVRWNYLYSFAVALLGTRRILGRRGCFGRFRAGGRSSRQGWVGEKFGLFENPTMGSVHWLCSTENSDILRAILGGNGLESAPADPKRFLIPSSLQKG